MSVRARVSESLSRSSRLLGSSALLILVAASCQLQCGAEPADQKGSEKKEDRSGAANSPVKKKRLSRKLIKAGRRLYKVNGCADCHSIAGKGCIEGEKLDGIAQRRTRAFIEKHLVDPEKHVLENYKVFNSEPNMMPHPNLTRRDVKAITEYLFSLPPFKKPQ